eukprot:3503539-Ditylum_brightwellii.AAC.1
MGTSFIGVAEKDVEGGESEVDVRDFGGDKVKMEEMCLYDVLLAQCLTYKDEEDDKFKDIHCLIHKAEKKNYGL